VASSRHGQHHVRPLEVEARPWEGSPIMGKANFLTVGALVECTSDYHADQDDARWEASARRLIACRW
jgi:hypothetical protein